MIFYHGKQVLITGYNKATNDVTFVYVSESGGLKIKRNKIVLEAEHGREEIEEAISQLEGGL